MAIIKNYLGDITGKIGGLVFQANRSGNIIRCNNSPKKTYSNASAFARSNFGISAKSWGTLDLDFKAGWEYYAQTYYRPKNYRSGVNYSGFNAYLGQANVRIGSNKKLCSIDIDAGGPTTALITPFVYDNMIPPDIFTGVLYNSDGLPVPISLGAITMDTNYTITMAFNYDVSNGTHPLVFAHAPTTRQMGFLVYGTKPNKNDRLQPQLFGFSGFPTITSGWTSPQPSFTLTFNQVNQVIGQFKNRYAQGQTAVLSVYMVSNFGEFAYLGTYNTRVTA